MLVTWSGMRKKLEQEYLADCLKGRIQYYVTAYRKSADEEGRAAIRLDGKEILKGSYFNMWHRWNDEHYALDDRNLTGVDLAVYVDGLHVCASLHLIFRMKKAVVREVPLLHKGSMKQ